MARPKHLSHTVRNCTFGHLRPLKTYINVRICQVWSESSLGAFWVAKDETYFFMRTTKAYNQTCAPNEITLGARRMVRFLILQYVFSYCGKFSHCGTFSHIAVHSHIAVRFLILRCVIIYCGTFSHIAAQFYFYHIIGAIAFSAHLRDSTSGLGDGQVIKFDIITTNEGNAYDASTGYFTCPQNGTYFFTSTLTSTYRAEFQGELVYNDRQQAVVYVAGSLGSHGHDQGANSVILNCIRGQHVCMRSVHDHRGNVYGGVYSTFSGFLL